MLLSALAVALLFPAGATAGAACPVTTTTVPSGAAVGCQTVSVAGLSMGDLVVAGALVALTLGAVLGRALLGRA